jgi:hypothetical protein
MSMATALKRMKLEAPVEISEELRTIALEAQAVLKHDALALTLHLPVESLAIVLERLGIKPFTPHSVRKYKDEKREAVNQSRGDYNYWRDTPIRDASDVPAFALRKAIQIKMAAPECKLFVQKLENNPDPFLVVEQW